MMRQPTIISVPTCTTPHCFDFLGSSSRIAQFAGVLTALTFTAIIFLAGREKQEHEELEDTIIMLFTAFVLLAITTYLYAEAASEQIIAERAAFEAFCASFVFALAVLQLFAGLARLVHHRGFSQASDFAASVANELIVFIVFGYLSLTAIDSASVTKSEHNAWHSSTALVCIVLLLLLLLAATNLDRFPGIRGPALGVRRAAWFSLILAALAASAAGVRAEFGASRHLVSSAIYDVAMGLGLIACHGFLRLVRTGRIASPHQPTSLRDRGTPTN